VSLKKSDFPSLGNVGDAENKPSEFGRKQTRFKVSEGLRTANIVSFFPLSKNDVAF